MADGSHIFSYLLVKINLIFSENIAIHITIQLKILQYEIPDNTYPFGCIYYVIAPYLKICHNSGSRSQNHDMLLT